MNDSPPAAAPIESCAVGPEECCGGDDLLAHVAAAAPGCPPPLVWRQVVEAYHAESSPWTIERGGRRLRGRSWGAGPPLFIRLNLWASAELFALTAYLLKDAVECIGFDAEPTDGDWSREPTGRISDEATDVLAAADLLGHDRFSLHGSGFGAAVALQTARQAPRRVERLSLHVPTLGGGLSLFERWAAAWGRSSRQPLSHSPKALQALDHVHRRWFPRLDVTRCDYFLQQAGAASTGQMARRAASLQAWSARDWIDDFPVPTLAIGVEGEGPAAEAARIALLKRVPGVKSEWLHTTGQAAYLTHPHRFAKVLREFMLPAAEVPETEPRSSHGTK